MECHKYVHARHGWGDVELLTDDHEQENDHHHRYDRLHLQEEHTGTLHRVRGVTALT